MPIIIIRTLALVGFLLSAYASYIERKRNQFHDYKAVCDINDKMSCTRAFTSEFGKMFGVSNSIWGMGFYLTVLVLNMFSLTNIIFYISIASVIGTIYLAYLLYFKVKSFCLICNAIYITNILLLIFSY